MLAHPASQLQCKLQVIDGTRAVSPRAPLLAQFSSPLFAHILRGTHIPRTYDAYNRPLQHYVLGSFGTETFVITSTSARVTSIISRPGYSNKKEFIEYMNPKGLTSPLT